MRNVTLAIRMLLKTPFVSAVAVLSLALGIGANAAIYSLFDQILVRKLPVPNAERLVNLSAPGPMPGSTSCNQAGDCDVIFSYPMFRDLERQQTALASIAAHRLFGASLSVDNEPSVGQGVWVSGGYFPTLGLQPALGRLFTPDDDRIVRGHDIVVISYNFWRDRFGGRSDVVGKTMIVNGRTLEIIGVTPQGFEGTTLGAQPLVYVPLTMRWAFSTSPYDGYENRRDYWIYAFGLLKPGSTAEEAAVGLNATYRPIINDVEAPLQDGMSDQTMERFKAKQMLVEAGAKGQSDVQREATTPLMMLFAITGTVLLIACANIANLLLARGAGRATEMGVRLALGATRRHLITQLLTEALILALVGGAVSLVVAKLTLSGIASILPPEAAASMAFGVDGTVMLFSAVLAVITGVAFGLFPALHSTRADLIATIRAGAGQITGGGVALRFRTILATAQIALSMALLASAGLFLKSLVNVSRVDLGVRIDNMVTFALSPNRVGYDTLRAAVLNRRVEEELAGIAGVTGVTSAMVALLAGNNWGTDVRVQGFACGPDTDCNSRLNEVGAGYFTTMGVPLVSGRDIQASDIAGAAQVAVVNEAFVRKFNLGNDAVGKFMNRRGNDSLDIQIVGVIPDVRYSDVRDEVPPVFYTPWMQNTRTTFMNFYVRTSLPPEQLLPQITALMKQIDPALPVEELKTMPQQVRENIFMDRMLSIMSASFAVLATLLAGIGLYGVLAYSVAQRTREIGVRMALGADTGNVYRLVLRQVGLMTLVGAGIGIAGALGLGRAARSMLYELQGHDPLVFASAIGMLGVVALVAGYVPAQRAARVEPMQALRYD